MLTEASTSIKRLGWDRRNFWRFPLAVTVFIRYQLDPFKRAMFEQYAKRWLTIIPRCGGDLVGYWMPHEGTNNIAFALISFENLAAYETYRARLRSDADGVANFNFAEEHKFILVEERTFLRQVVSETGPK
jgi:NIPSNAP